MSSPALDTTIGTATNVTNITNDISSIKNNASINSTTINAADDDNSVEKLSKAPQASMVATNKNISNNSTTSSSNLIESINIKEGFVSKDQSDHSEGYSSV